MFSSPLLSFALVSALVGTAVSGYSILSPGGSNLWWVAQSANTLVWACHDNPPATSFQLLINNTAPTILASPMAIVAGIQNADCSHTITTQQAALTPATGYTLVFADTLDQTKIYATSDLFEVKALGASYPPSSATPTESTSSTSGSPSGTSTGSGSTSTSSKSSNSAFTSFQISGAGALAAIGVAIGVL